MGLFDKIWGKPIDRKEIRDNLWANFEREQNYFKLADSRSSFYQWDGLDHAELRFDKYRRKRLNENIDEVRQFLKIKQEIHEIASRYTSFEREREPKVGAQYDALENEMKDLLSSDRKLWLEEYTEVFTFLIVERVDSRKKIWGTLRLSGHAQIRAFIIAAREFERQLRDGTQIAKVRMEFDHAVAWAERSAMFERDKDNNLFLTLYSPHTADYLAVPIARRTVNSIISDLPSYLGP